MSGDEAGLVVGLIPGIISIIEATKKVYDAAKDAKGQPDAFRHLAARLPLVITILQSAEERTRNLDETAQEALESILDSCKAKAENHQRLFQEVIRADDDQWYDRYKKALKALGKGDKVRCLMKGMLEDVQVRACERLEGTATGTELKEIEEAVMQMKEMPPSLQEETGGVTKIIRAVGTTMPTLEKEPSTMEQGISNRMRSGVTRILAVRNSMIQYCSH